MFYVKSESKGHSVVSDSLRPHGLYSSWNSPGQNTGVGSLSLLQGIFPTQGLNSGLLHSRQILYQLSHKGSPWVRGRTSKAEDTSTEIIIMWGSEKKHEGKWTVPETLRMWPRVSIMLKGRARKKETKGKMVNFMSVARPQYPEIQPNLPLDASATIF